METVEEKTKKIENHTCMRVEPMIQCSRFDPCIRMNERRIEHEQEDSDVLHRQGGEEVGG